MNIEFFRHDYRLSIDRTNDIIRNRQCYCADTQIMAHVREKNAMLRAEVARRSRVLAASKVALQAERHEMNRLKSRLGRSRFLLAIEAVNQKLNDDLMTSQNQDQ